MYVLKDDKIGIQLRARTLDSGVALVKFAANTGTRTVVVGTDVQEGMLKMIRNDAGLAWHDMVQDGLGWELEKELGTCWSRSGSINGCDCRQIAVPRHTDGDGISDGWETLGRIDMQPFQLLPKWGADPRHKDLFIEVDFMRRNGVENADKIVKHMRVSAARISPITADSFTKIRGPVGERHYLTKP